MSISIYVAQPYGGMDPAQMEGYLTYYYEYHFLYLTGIDHVESKSIQGAALMKLVFHHRLQIKAGEVGSLQGSELGFRLRNRGVLLDCD